MDACVDPSEMSCPRRDYGADGPCTDAVYGSVKDSDCDDSDDHAATSMNDTFVDGLYLASDCDEAYDTHCERC